VDGVVLITGSVDPFNPKVVRASAGSLFHVPVVSDVSLPELRDLELPLVGTSSHEGEPITAADLTRPLALVMGSEAHGIDRQMTLPQRSFLYMPYMHSEDIDMQDRSVALFKELAESAPSELLPTWIIQPLPT